MTTKLGEMLKIQTLGGLAVFDEGRMLPLPPSRKTRALLAYLAVTGRKQRRERLCEMFWDIPDDPRGSLRWSLSKIRQVLGDALEEAGCNAEDVLQHCRGPGPHVRGCHVVDLLLGKQ